MLPKTIIIRLTLEHSKALFIVPNSQGAQQGALKRTYINHILNFLPLKLKMSTLTFVHHRKFSDYLWYDIFGLLYCFDWEVYTNQENPEMENGS